MGWRPDVYSSPEMHGLEIVAELERDSDSYGFNKTVLWRDKQTGTFYYASDSGCSCPSPFQDFTRVSDLNVADTWWTLRQAVATSTGDIGRALTFLDHAREAGLN